LERGEEGFCYSGSASSRFSQSVGSPSGVQEVDSLRSRVMQLEAQLHRNRLSSSQTDVARENSNMNELGSSNSGDTDHEDNLSEDNNAEFDHNETLTPSADENTAQVSQSVNLVIKDAASILEFLAWGRRKNPEHNSVTSPEVTSNVEPGDFRDAQVDSISPNDIDDSCQMAYLQSLLPSKRQMSDLTRYHEESLLWYHCSYFAPTFRAQVELFYDRFQGNIENPGVNMQWLALLFAVITGSIICAPSRRAQSWGFRARERETLSRRWFRAVYTCLNKAEYAANQSILSVQAISTLTISAHLLGFSNQHSIHLAAVVRVAQGLGLHRINEDYSASIVEKECGRRLWSQLCAQDWFSIPFSDTYLINPLYSQSEQPMNCHDEDMVSLPENVPTITTYCRFLTQIASIMPQLQDDFVSCNTPFTKYEQVIHWDKQMRSLSTSERPLPLTNLSLEPSWPKYIPWARRSLAVSSSHKIIMIHRSFLSESFTNPAFSFTRRTCLAAARTIIKGFKDPGDDDEPTLWIYQAFSVAASIILILDVLHRHPNESEYKEHKKLAEDTVNLLQKCQNSMIANRGIKLLSALLQEIDGNDQLYYTRKRRLDGTPAITDQNRRSFNVPTFIKSFCIVKPHGTSTNLSNFVPNTNGSITEATSLSEINTDLYSTASYEKAIENSTSFFMPGLEGATSFENLLYLANHDFV
jgi:hypothetical protein